MFPEPRGGVSLVWDSNPDNEYGGGDVTALRLSPSLEAFSHRVKLDDSEELHRPQAALLSGRRGLAYWWTPDPEPGCELTARFFALPALLFADAFEGGSTKAWSVVVE